MLSALLRRPAAPEAAPEAAVHDSGRVVEVVDRGRLVRLRVPTVEEVLAAAAAAGLPRGHPPYAGELCGWWASFSPRRNRADGWRNAVLLIGDPQLWALELEWTSGPEAPPVVTETRARPTVDENTPRPSERRPRAGEGRLS